MLKRKIFALTLICFLMIAYFKTDVHAQSNLTLYHSKNLPQTTYANAAFRSDAKFYFGLPFLSSQYFNFGNTTLNLDLVNNAIEKTSSGNILNLTKLGGSFYKNNYLSLQYNIDLFNLGFKIRKSYFSINTSINQDFRVRYPGDVFKFLTEGNGYNNLGYKFNFGFGIDYLSYIETGIGYNRKFLNDKLTLGTRIRFIKGVANLNTKKNDLTLRTAPNGFDYTIGAEIDIRAAGPAPIDNLEEMQKFNPLANVRDLLTSNTGFGLNLGAEYELNDFFSFSVALNNLGRIIWDANTFAVKSRKSGETLTFDGINFNHVFDSSSSSDIYDDLQDSIYSKFAIDTFKPTYRTGLFPEFYIGGQYHITKNHRAGVILYGTYFQRKLSPALTLTYNGRLTRVLSVTATYTTLNRTFLNGGLGFSLNLGPMQFYLMSDNILGSLNTKKFKSINGRAGLNLTIGRKNKKKNKEDNS